MAEELDLDPIEPVEDPKPKKGTGSKPRMAPPAEASEPKAKSKKGASRGEQDDEEAERKTRKTLVGDRKVPYPPSPENVPEGLTDYPDSFVKQQNLLLAGLFVFLCFYLGAFLFCILIASWSIWSFSHWPLLKIILLVATGISLLFLIRGFFKRAPMNKEMHIEITEDEHPLLFAFIQRLCDELDAPEPNKVFVSPDVNAACIPRVSLLNLFVEPKKDLLIGLGRVNCSNLTEFKSVLAHEFGHFSHLGRTSSYAWIVQQVILNLITGEDWLDRLIDGLKKTQSFKGLGYALGGPLWLWRTILWQSFKLIALQERVVRREQEFHADLVAVKAAGSDAVPFRLMRARFGMDCFIQAINDLSIAMDHKLYSNDMFLHQDRAATVVRRKKKDPNLGLLPPLDHPLAGKSLRVFDPAEEDPLDNVPEMDRTHPPDHEREENAKEIFVPGVIDNRSPWILFDNPAELRERMTYKFYRMVFKIPKNTELTDAIKVQKFIDNEHADTTYDPKYKGAYDERILEPGDLSELNSLIRDTPWTEERMEKVLDKLYDGCEEHAEAHSELHKEWETLTSSVVGRPSKTMKRKIEEVEEKQEANRDWFKSFDRRVYLLHIQMAAQVDKELKDELVERYRFQLEVQRFYFEARQAFSRADLYFSAYIAAAQGKIQVGPDFGGEVMQVLRTSWKTLKNIIKDAREINLPAMKNFEEGENLAAFILEGKMVPEPPLTYAKGTWINKLMTQLDGVKHKCFRLHFKSLGGILRVQEEIATKWKQLREPVAAEVIDVEPIAGEIVAAEVIPAEPIVGEIVAAEVLPDEPIAAEVIAEEIPAAPVAPPLPPSSVPNAPEPSKAMAAFVEPSPPLATELGTSAPVPPTQAPAPAAVEPTPRESLPSADPFDFSAPAPKPAPPKSAVIAAPAPPAPPPTRAVPVAASDTFSLDAEEPAAPAPAPAPVVSVVPTPVPAAEIFSLDAEAVPAKPVEPSFSLDADDYKAAPPAPAAKAIEPKPASAVIPAAAATEPAFGVFPAAAASPPGSTAVPAPAARTSPVTPASPPPAEPAKPALSGVVEVPAAKAAFGTGAKPGIKRPPIKITMVKPGETSPLAK